MNGVAGSSPFASAVTCRVSPAQLEYPWRCARSRRADGERDAVHGGDALRPALVVLEVGAERLLGELVDERRPARVALLAREHGLGARELDRQVAESGNGADVACPRRLDQVLCLLAKLLEVHLDLLPLRPVSAAGGKKIDSSCGAAWRWAQPFPRTGCALARSARS